MKLTKLTNRIMYVSPTVQAGWETQSYRSDFQNLSILGQGTYGVVWKGKHKKTGEIYAIKQIKKKTLNTPSLINHVRNQVKIMYELNHTNIIKLYNHFQDEFAIYFILEFAEKGELYKALVKQPTKKFEEQEAAKMIKEIANAIQYIHKKNVIHRDIKPQNILISKDDTLKLADFGWSNFTQGQNKRETYCGTLDYLAPQMVDKNHLHDYRVDIWSIGVLIYQLCTGSSPFSSQLNTKALPQIIIKKNIANLNYKIPKELSNECRDLISRILVLDPEKRISIAEILSHPWLKQVSKIEQPDLEDNEKWEVKLKQEFGIVLETKQEEIQKYEIFTKQDIYKNSRIESIINAQKPKVHDHKEKKVELLELRLKQLQKINKWQEQELKYLRNIKQEHQQCSIELTSLKQVNRQNVRKIENMSSQLQQYQRIIQKYQK